MRKTKILIGTDTISGIAPQILRVFSQVSDEKTLPYGNDIFTTKCKNIISNVFEKQDLEIIPMMSGTASNSLALSSFLRSYGSILCHSESHINKDEGGAPEFFSGGGKLQTISNTSGRLNSKDITEKLNELNFKGKQHSKISGISVTQLAENGTLYSQKEIMGISKICKENNFYLHMDGARFSNALVSQQSVSPAEATWKIGIDCLSLGATKNGAMAAEVIIFFNKNLATEAKKMIKQTGHIIPKTRFISAQLNAWFEDGLWLKLAQKANENATYLSSELSKFEDFRLLYPTQGNEVFLRINKETYIKILELNIIPNLWREISDDEIEVRFVTSFETKLSLIDEIINRFKTCFSYQLEPII
ncbi:beta-eliminating lyase-related protein [Alphaproteobacteria bacterium]|nr:beta-eliminating lyase-related protein [Alphaproteobacteria bacterium]